MKMVLSSMSSYLRLPRHLQHVAFAPTTLCRSTLVHGSKLRQRPSYGSSGAQETYRTSTKAQLIDISTGGKKTRRNGRGHMHVDGAAALQGRFMIPADEVRQLAATHQVSVDELLFSLIKPASMLARPPISGFHVGAVGLGASGAIYVGVNVEFPKAHLNNSIHAEQFLLINCLHHGEEQMTALAVSAAPCGHCRQFYAEIHEAEKIRFLFGEQGAASKPRFLDDLLPDKFGPQDLSSERFPLLLQQQQNKVQFSKKAIHLREWLRTAAGESSATIADRAEEPAPDAVEGAAGLPEGDAEDMLFKQAADAALTAAQQSYSPYTRSPSGAAIITASGSIFSGSYLECVAYNPSLSPFQVAWAKAIMGGVGSFEEIQQVLLAEVHAAPVKHKNGIKSLLKTVAPRAKLTTLSLCRS